MNIATRLTSIRILLVPIFIIFLIYSYNKKNVVLQYIALCIFLISTITDALDGTIARLYGQKTALGSFLDPLADKFLLISAFVILTYMQKLPLFFCIIFTSREFLISVSWFTYYIFTNRLEVTPTMMSKISTALEMCIVVLFLLDIKYVIIRPLLWVAVILSVYSGLGYIFRGSRLLENKKVVKLS